MPYKLLIVDDEYHIRDGLLSFPWEELGFTALAAAADGFEALKFIESHNIDVLLTDIRIPNMDGLSLCEIVRESHPDCRLVLISGHKNFEYAKTAIRVGVTDYLLKPIDLEELERLFRKIREELDGRSEKEGAGDCSHSIGDAAEFIRRNYQESLTLADVAEEVSLSPAYFSSRFKKELKKGFSEYLNEVRVDKAKQLLGQMNLKVYEVAGMVGFSNPKYFTDIFKRTTGMSPNKYRRTLLSSREDKG